MKFTHLPPLLPKIKINVNYFFSFLLMGSLLKFGLLILFQNNIYFFLYKTFI